MYKDIYVRLYWVKLFRPAALTLFILGADFRGAIRFGVVTNKQVAEAISLKEDETVYLNRRLNSSLVSGPDCAARYIKSCFWKLDQ